MQDTLSETRNIALPRGGVLEVKMSEALYGRIRNHFGLSFEQKVNDDHIRMFIWGAVNNAVEKAERGVKDAAGIAV